MIAQYLGMVAVVVVIVFVLPFAAAALSDWWNGR